MQISKEEQEILEGKQGVILQKALQTLKLYGEALESEKFVEIEGMGHLVVATPTIGNGIRKEMLLELVNQGVKCKFPFTLDPPAPLGNEDINFDRRSCRFVFI